MCGSSSSAQDGTYRAFNPLDKWTSGDYTATDRRMTFRHDPFCLEAGFKGPAAVPLVGQEREAEAHEVAIGSDPCGGRFQTAVVPALAASLVGKTDDRASPAGYDRPVRLLLNGRGGKVGSVLAPALEAAGHELVTISARPT